MNINPGYWIIFVAVILYGTLTPLLKKEWQSDFISALDKPPVIIASCFWL